MCEWQSLNDTIDIEPILFGKTFHIHQRMMSTSSALFLSKNCTKIADYCDWKSELMQGLRTSAIRLIEML